MLSGEESAASKLVHGGTRIPPRNEDALLLGTLCLPTDSDPVGGVLARETEELWHESRADRFKPDQADSGDSMALVKLRPEARRKLDLHDSWIDPEVHEDASPDHALDNREPHVRLSR